MNSMLVALDIVLVALLVFIFAMGYALRCAVEPPPLPPRAELPPATARQLDRARRANRLDLRLVHRRAPSPQVSFDEGETK